MSDTNYISSIVKILEEPKQTLINKTINVTKFRAQLAQNGNNTIVNLVFWGSLGKDIMNYYKLNDYIIIEGYLSFEDNEISNLSNSNFKRVKITVLKVYPFLLSSTKFLKKE